MDPVNGTSTKLTGFHGSGDTNGPAAYASFNKPETISKAGGGILVLADNGNHKVKLVDQTGSVSLLYGVSSNLWVKGTGQFPGWYDGPGTPSQGSAESRQPYGVLVGPDGSVYATEDYYHILRHITGTGLTAPQPGYPQVFNTLAGIALDPSGTTLYIADYTNNAVKLLNFGDNQTSTFLNSSDGVSRPASVLVDPSGYYVYVLNQGTAANGSILEFDIFGFPYGPIATGLNQPTAFTMDGYGTFFVTEQAGSIRAFGASVSNTVVTITNANVSLQGIAIFDDGQLAVSDAGNHVIWTVNPLTKLVRRLTGQLGTNGTTLGFSNSAKLFQPHQLARAGNNQIVIADYGNNRLVVSTRAGTVTNVLSSTNSLVWTGRPTDPVGGSNVTMRLPAGVAVSSAGLVYDSEPTNHAIRRLTAALAAPPSAPIVPLPFFNAPQGIALNNSRTKLFIADPTNNMIGQLDLGNNQTTVFLDSSSGIYQPVDVALDSSDNIYVLNQGTGGNGSIIEFDQYGNLLGTNAASLSMLTAMKLTFAGDIYVSELNGVVQKISSTGSNTVATITTNANVRLSGIALLDNGSVVVSDAGNQVLWKIAPAATNAVLFTGVLGSPGTNFGAIGFAKLNKPQRLAQAFGGLLLIADSGNNRVVVANDLGTISSALNSTNATLWFGLTIDPVSAGSPNFVSMLSPVGIAIGPAGTVFVSETTYKDIRGMLNTGIQAPIPPPPAPLNLVATATYGQVTLTWSAANGATNYNVKRSTSTNSSFATIGSTSTTTFTDTNLLAGSTYYYVVSAVNAGGESPNSDMASATPLIPPPPAPRIGWFDYEGDFLTGFFTVLHPVSTATFHNDTLLAIDPGTNGVSTYYITTNGPGPIAAEPSATNGFSPPFYQDNLAYAQPLPITIMQDLIVKAVNVGAGGSSPIVTAEFRFQAANPIITGNNGAEFTVSDITSNAVFWYTIDGSDPTNGPPSIGPIASGTNNTPVTLSLNASTNILFKVLASRNGYQPSGIAVQSFSPDNFRPNLITFGTGTGEPKSKFIARPGQFYYAPVTLQLTPNFNQMYSLQFNVAVTNGFTNIFSSAAIPPIINGAGIDFFSMLMTSVKPEEGQYFPPADGSWYLTLLPLTEQVVLGVTNFPQTVFVNTNNNLLGVGWLYRTGFKYKAFDILGNVFLDFDTTKQDLIAYSIDHDTLFKKSKGIVMVGAYSFMVPTNAVNGDQYFIQLGSPSATSDGVGAPGASIYIQPPAISQAVTVGSPSYLVGDAAPFNWLNAGDFGDTNLDNSDVMQVYQAGIVAVNMPPLNSDLYAAMDSAGGFGAFDSANGYYTNSGSATVIQQQAMWDGNDLTINTNAFGDGFLDVNDLYVTLRRSLDPSLVWFKRYWTNNMFVAVTNINYAFNTNIPHARLSKTTGSVALHKDAGDAPAYLSSSVTFTAGDAIAAAGNTIQIPITANVFGSYPLRVLGLNLTVHPLDGAPDLTQQVTFTPSAALGTPNISSSKHLGNYCGAWLNSAVAGVSNSAIIGTLTVTLPANVTSSSAYAVHFDKASGSPNGLALFPKQTFTGLITTTALTNSTYGDGIPDAWRLRWFGTVNNLLTLSNACPSGDGISNWKKFVAGVDPNTANNFPSVNARTPVPSGSTTAILWPTVSGKKYAIERSTTLFPGAWTSIGTNTGTCGDIEFDDNNAGKVKFYRVRILP